eukprot:g40326.t1
MSTINDILTAARVRTSTGNIRISMPQDALPPQLSALSVSLHSPDTTTLTRPDSPTIDTKPPPPVKYKQPSPPRARVAPPHLQARQAACLQAAGTPPFEMANKLVRDRSKPGDLLHSTAGQDVTGKTGPCQKKRSDVFQSC